MPEEVAPLLLLLPCFIAMDTAHNVGMLEQALRFDAIGD